MYFKQFYHSLKDKEIVKKIQQEGFDPIKIHNQPGDVYPTHHHPETKLLAILTGDMNITINGTSYNCSPGDKILIQGNIEHSAIVGTDGCEFYWSEKIV